MSDSPTAAAASVKPRYRIINWPQYNQALVQRGSLTLWIDEDAIASWFYQGPHQRGAQLVYSDSTILLLLTLKAIFKLPLRMVEGLAQSILQLMSLELPVPDYSTLCRRAAKLSIELPSLPSNGPIDLVIDSTGLKVYGEGEWKVRQHGYSKRRTWLKLHLAVNPQTHEIKAAVMTEAGVSDGEVAEELINQVDEEVKTVIGDGGYDRSKVYEAAKNKGAEPVIPPRADAKINEKKGEDDPRNKNIKAIEEQGKAEWKKKKGYHKRSLVETTMGRMKGIFGSKLSSREWMRQAMEVGIRCVALKRMTHLGMPISVRIA